MESCCCVQTAGSSRLMNVVPSRKGRVSSGVNGHLGSLHLLMAVHRTCLPMNCSRPSWNDPDVQAYGHVWTKLQDWTVLLLLIKGMGRHLPDFYRFDIFVIRRWTLGEHSLFQIRRLQHRKTNTSLVESYLQKHLCTNHHQRTYEVQAFSN